MKASFIHYKRSACIVLLLRSLQNTAMASTTKDYWFLLLNYLAFYFTTRLFSFFHKIITEKRYLKKWKNLEILNTFFIKKKHLVCFQQTLLKNQCHCNNIKQIKYHIKSKTLSIPA